ncbi:hypothetical protein ANN_04158 [Periplaneta americana]|uniref:Serpin domain-containing protein n=1 Tax=Periplaneta americana TaxID=6978 RepID=A0ABQ8T7T1_PERAM|nr:hypothetical protein ANN_04158 [Periplaneta americana]
MKKIIKGLLQLILLIAFLFFSGDPESVLQTINQWAASHTNGVINKLYSHPLPATTAAVLTNAIYFKGDWETPFNPRHTIAGTFKSNETHAVAVQYMRGQFDLMYVESKRTGCRMVAIPYKHAKAAMYVILPDKGNIYSIQAFAASLSVEDILELISTTKMASVSLVMPKMKLSHVFSLRKVLSHFRKDIGASLRDAVHRHRMTHQNGGSTHSLRCHGWNCTQFNQPPCNSSLHTQSDGSILNVTSNVTAEDDKLSFDMSGASPDYQFRIDDIIQHVYVEVSELGTIAAAVGGTIVDYFGDYTNFVMDRPFLFFIRHEVTGTPLFWGTIVEPTNT